MRQGPVRILHIVGGMFRHGVETILMNYYRHIDRNKIQFDFLTMIPGEHDYDTEIRSLGGRIFSISPPNKSQPLKHLLDLTSLMQQEGPFWAVHAHTMHHSGLVMLAAKLAGIKIRISHSHNTSDWGEHLLWRKIYFVTAKILIRRYATRLVACGSDAAVYLFGKSLVKSGKVIFLPNALDLESYLSLDESRTLFLRRQLGILEDTLVIGHIGRFSPQKNHAFFIPLLRQIKSVKSDVRLILVGEGELRKQLENELLQNDLYDDVIFLGVRSDIAEIMSVFNVFVLPSIYEGLPVVLLEAQATGTPCVVSSAVTKEADMGLNLVEYLDLKSKTEDWCNVILSQSKRIRPPRELIIDKFRQRGYDASVSEKSLIRLYEVL